MVWAGVVKSAQRYLAGTPEATCDLELVGELVETYLCWKEMCVDTHGAYERWCDDLTDSRRRRYAAFIAALDREEAAAAEYRRVTERMTIAEDAARLG